MTNSINEAKLKNIEKLTQQLNLEKLLDKNEKTFYKLFHNSNDFIIVTQMQDNGLPGSIIEVNDVACSKLGYTREELLELPQEKLGRHIKISSTGKVKKDLLAEQYVFFEMNFFTKSGSIIPVEVNASTFVVNGDKVVLSIARDITDRKEIKKKLVENNKELKATLDELKQVQEQLVQQEKLAGIGQLAAGVAHEINNPLGYIYSNVQTSREYFTRYKKMLDSYKAFIDSLHRIPSEKLESKIWEIKTLEEKSGLDFVSTDIEDLFEDVEDGLKRISEIVTSLKSFSRVDHSRELEEYDLNKGIKNTLLMARNEIKHHARVVEVLSDIPVIKAMGNQIDQVLLNIILNAVYAVKARELSDLGLIIVSTHISNGCILCQIEDNGIGIEDVNVKKIFDPFFTTKPTGKGTGLGLSIAYDIIVNKHGGEILVESTPKVGTKFIIKLPIKKTEQETL